MSNNCMNILFSSPLYPSSRSPLVFCLLFYVYILINFKKQDPCKTWVKISKVMPQPQVHSPRKGREALRQKVLNLSFKIRYGLTVHIIRFYRQNFQFFKIVPSSQIPANYANSAQFAHTVRELGKIRTFC